jgi:hypothetical protein
MITEKKNKLNKLNGKEIIIRVVKMKIFKKLKSKKKSQKKTQMKTQKKYKKNQNQKSHFYLRFSTKNQKNCLNHKLTKTIQLQKKLKFNLIK